MDRKHNSMFGKWKLAHKKIQKNSTSRKIRKISPEKQRMSIYQTNWKMTNFQVNAMKSEEEYVERANSSEGCKVSIGNLVNKENRDPLSLQQLYTLFQPSGTTTQF